MSCAPVTCNLRGLLSSHMQGALFRLWWCRMYKLSPTALFSWTAMVLGVYYLANGETHLFACGFPQHTNLFQIQKVEGSWSPFPLMSQPQSKSGIKHNWEEPATYMSGASGVLWMGELGLLDGCNSAYNGTILLAEKEMLIDAAFLTLAEQQPLKIKEYRNPVFLCMRSFRFSLGNPIVSCNHILSPDPDSIHRAPSPFPPG